MTGLRQVRAWASQTRRARVLLWIWVGTFLLAGVPRWEWHVHAANDLLVHTHTHDLPDWHGHDHADAGTDQVVAVGESGEPTLLAHVHACAALCATLPHAVLPVLAGPDLSRWLAPRPTRSPVPQTVTPADRPPIG